MSEPVYSPGLEGIIAGETAVSTITDGLRYRGYAVEQLADLGTFEETAYLLLHGDLPTTDELTAFRQRLAAAAALPPEITELLRQVPRDAPLMDVMRSGASLLAHWDPDTKDNSHAANVRKAERLLAQLPVVLAAASCLRRSKEPVHADPSLSLSGNLLWMINRQPPTPQAIRAMDITLVMYAEHEFNASTFAARVIVSTTSDLHSAVVGAIGALKGPLHGGANEQVIAVLDEIGGVEKADAWVRNALAQKRRIMGFGHRVYKTGDPRARYLKPWCQKLAAESGHESLEQMAEVVERIVGEQKNLPPNLDWPSARLYHYLGLPVELYTPLFVVSRVSGWSAHVIEQLDNNRLIRPLGRYTGPGEREFKPVGERVK